jgi:hypothetical protein
MAFVWTWVCRGGQVLGTMAMAMALAMATAVVCEGESGLEG